MAEASRVSWNAPATRWIKQNSFSWFWEKVFAVTMTLTFGYQNLITFFSPVTFFFNWRIWYFSKQLWVLDWNCARHIEREGGRRREWDGDHKHLSSGMRQVFNLRIKTVWKFISMLMALCLSRPDEASSSEEEEEEIHLNCCHNNTQPISIRTLLPQSEKTFNGTWLTIKHHQALQSNHLSTALSM